MKSPLQPGRAATAVVVAVAAIICASLLIKGRSAQPETTKPVQGSGEASNAATSNATTELSPSQLNAVKIDPAGTYRFPVEKEGVGSIDFDEDLSVQVFSPYQGKIITALANPGDEVQKGQAIYTVASPDLIQAESTLIGAAGTFAFTSEELARVRDLCGTNGVSARELEQATSDQQSAEGALQAARNAVRLFGKTESEIDQLIDSRKIDPELVVISPLTGRVTARNAQPGLLVQPGNAPAPYSVADLSTKWMVANVSESDSPPLQVGQAVQAKVMAFPERVFEGRISTVGAAVDSNTHRVMVRSEIADPKNELRPGMLASFLIQVQDPVESVAIPTEGVVREGDGTMAAWVTTDRHHFSQRIVRIGLQKDGRYQVLEGLRRGELVVTDGAIFLSNLLHAPPTD